MSLRQKQDQERPYLPNQSMESSYQIYWVQTSYWLSKCCINFKTKSSKFVRKKLNERVRTTTKTINYIDTPFTYKILKTLYKNFYQFLKVPQTSFTK